MNKKHKKDSLMIVPLSDGDVLMTGLEACGLLSITPATLHTWTIRGLVPSYRVGERTIRYRRRELEQLIKPAGYGGSGG